MPETVQLEIAQRPVTQPPSAQPASAAQMMTASQRELLDQLLDKWSMQVLDRLCGNPLRFNELRRAIPVVTQKSLTATLRRLERNGMVERIVTSSRPVSVEYRVTRLGSSLEVLIDALLDWTTDSMPQVERARAQFDGIARG